MPLDPEAITLLDLVAKTGVPDYSTLTPEAARGFFNARQLPAGPAVSVRDLTMEGPDSELALRLYRPLDAKGEIGGLVYFHGGGWVIGNLESHDALCRALCVQAGCAVVAVDYRLAPEHKFPAAVNDAYAALSWVHERADELGIDHRKLCIGGDSAGASLATVAARLAKERRGAPILLQLLIYPVTDLRSLDTASYQEFTVGHLLTRSAMGWFREHYLRNEQDREDPSASPLAAKNLIGLPPAVVVTAECDVLRDEGEAYAAALKKAGVATELRRYPGMTHSFVGLHAYLTQGRIAVADCAADLKRAMG